MKNIKEPVRLREKKLKDGGVSLYLDIYYEGIRKYEFLKLYLIPEKSRADKERNKTTLAIANSIKAKRVIEIQSGAYDVKLASRADVPFFVYYGKMRQQIESRKNRLWEAVRIIILDYCKNEALEFKKIDVKFVEGLREYIDTKEHRAEKVSGGLSHGTKNIYWAIVKAVFNQAVRDGIIDKNPTSNIQGFKPSEPKRTYLTASEVKRLSQTDCKSDGIKKAFLFCCLTGLRYSDVKALTWGDVSKENGYTRITFRQKKTKHQEYLDINKSASSLMGERGRAEREVFPLYCSLDHVNHVLKEWAKNAEIAKNISFHVSRHTFATMMLSNGVDLYTVSKLVGHKSISTTQIYAKVMDKEKQRAVDTIPDDII